MDEEIHLHYKPLTRNFYPYVRFINVLNCSTIKFILFCVFKIFELLQSFTILDQYRFTYYILAMLSKSKDFQNSESTIKFCNFLDSSFAQICHPHLTLTIKMFLMH